MHTLYVCSHDVCMHAHNTDKHSCTLNLYTFIHVPTYTHAQCICIQPLYMYTSTHKLILPRYTHARCVCMQPLYMCTSTHKLIYTHPHQVHCTCVSSYMHIHAPCTCMQSLYIYKSTHKLILPIYRCTMYIYTATTGWQRLIGCFKSQVIFRKRATNYRAVLRKMTCKDKASYDSTPPCIYVYIHT